VKDPEIRRVDLSDELKLVITWEEDLDFVKVAISISRDREVFHLPPFILEWKEVIVH